MAEDRCYTVEEIKEILGISRQSVYELLKAKEFQWIRVGGKYRISRPSFDKWLDGDAAKEPEKEPASAAPAAENSAKPVSFSLSDKTDAVRISFDLTELLRMLNVKIER